MSNIQPDKNDELITSHEAARIVGLSEQTLRHWRMKRMHLEYVVLTDGRSVRYEKSEVEALARRRNTVLHRVEVGNA